MKVSLINKTSFIGVLALAWLSSAHASTESAGRVTFVLGKATLTDVRGSVTRLERGAQVSTGDRIETFSNGHVHVRFIDDALLSIRPNSALHIEDYVYDSLEPQNSAIKLHLEEGVARSISGEAAKAARGRFRLNTPVAAIGVRGTDFVVSAALETTKALVNEGAIVIAPLSDSCLAETFGPCAQDGLELSARGLQLASLRGGETTLTQISASQSIESAGAYQQQFQLMTSEDASQQAGAIADNAPDTSDESAALKTSNEVLLEGITSPSVQSNAQTAAVKVAATDFIPTDAITVTSDGAVKDFDYTPPSLMTLESLSDRQLVWGRYADDPLLSDKLALDFKEASESRSISVGSLSYGLFRRDAIPKRVSSEAGFVGFQLTSAQAIFNSDSGIAVLRVNGGDLSIDFHTNLFQTALSLSHETIGPISFSASGRLFDGGFFRALEDTQRLAGAVSYDAAEAGYFFEKQLSNGSLSGLTLWDSK